MTTGPNHRVRLSGTVEVASALEEAFSLFTPSGERAWARGWRPMFPSPSGDETEPGTAFLTSHGGRDSIWIVVRCEPGRCIEYATVTPGWRCGLLTVACKASGGATTATVSYDLTALSDTADADLDTFAADYPSFLDHWQSAIAEALRR